MGGSWSGVYLGHPKKRIQAKPSFFSRAHPVGWKCSNPSIQGKDFLLSSALVIPFIDARSKQTEESVCLVTPLVASHSTETSRQTTSTPFAVYVYVHPKLRARVFASSFLSLLDSPLPAPASRFLSLSSFHALSLSPLLLLPHLLLLLSRSVVWHFFPDVCSSGAVGSSFSFPLLCVWSGCLSGGSLCLSWSCPSGCVSWFSRCGVHAGALSVTGPEFLSHPRNFTFTGVGTHSGIQKKYLLTLPLFDEINPEVSAALPRTPL